MENEKKEKIFADGLFFNRPNEQAPTSGERQSFN